MILPCGCDSITTGYFDLCVECRNRASLAGQIACDHDRALGYHVSTIGMQPHNAGWLGNSWYQPPEKDRNGR